MKRTPIQEEAHKRELVDRYVPASIRKFVCVCTDKRGAAVVHPHNPKALACPKCLKYYRYVIRTCNTCSKKFIKAWTHKNECKSSPTCWDCLEARDTKCPCPVAGCNFGYCDQVVTDNPDSRITDKREELTLAQVLANARKAMES